MAGSQSRVWRHPARGRLTPAYNPRTLQGFHPPRILPMKRLAILSVLILAGSYPVKAETDPSQVFGGRTPPDRRLDRQRTLNDYFPFTPPDTKAAWEKRRQQVREDLLVATGLWPMPPKTPLQPVIHGKIDRDDYTIEKVFFASLPGHYVSGNLYRPKGDKPVKRPGILRPHGHFANGRMYDAGEQAARNEIKSGAERTIENARFLQQASLAQLARMGCVVFQFDMIGYADSQAIPHREGFRDVEAELRLQSFMGLQVWNCIRALDFLTSLPDVDPARIGVTGASGGGTQTFMLCALDERPAAAFPAVMVSTAMQGGCVCENCSYLRQDTGNVEIAALFAPKPLGMTGARDWTIDIETKGLPELKSIYRLYGAEDKVHAKCYPQFGHNLNVVAREMMYNWFNRHLKLGQPEPVVEKPIRPVPPADLSVYHTKYTLPSDAGDARQVRQYLTESSEKQIAGLLPHNAEELKEYRRVMRTALRVMVNDDLPAREDIETTTVRQTSLQAKPYIEYLSLSRRGKGEAVPALLITSTAQGPQGTVLIWVHGDGKTSLFDQGKLVPKAQQLLDKGTSILAIDCLQTGEYKDAKPQPVNNQFAGYTFGYNRPLLANRVHDILTAIGYARLLPGTKRVDLVGFDRAGPWVVMARALCGDAIGRTVADMNRFRFEEVKKLDDEMMLPGAIKYGGMGTFLALCAPGEVYVHNHRSTTSGEVVKQVYKLAEAPSALRRFPEKASLDQVMEWLQR